MGPTVSGLPLSALYSASGLSLLCSTLSALGCFRYRPHYYFADRYTSAL
jgi:hypothetical protein